jgi:hypothetical protein
VQGPTGHGVVIRNGQGTKAVAADLDASTSDLEIPLDGAVDGGGKLAGLDHVLHCGLKSSGIVEHGRAHGVGGRAREFHGARYDLKQATGPNAAS